MEPCECNLQRRSSQWDGASVLSVGPSKPEKLLYSTLHLQTDSSFTGLACRKWDWVSFFFPLRRCLGPARLGVGCGVTLPGITAGVKYTQRQACCTVVSVVNFSSLENWVPKWDIHYRNKTSPYISVRSRSFQSLEVRAFLDFFRLINMKQTD